mmetsp:Transcript_29833/g.64340  ORF Transcript_29833/g.64340 Transcript_29833/m.64340 type:complete len:105 (+) Transcript_29833:452-766(+)
MLQLARNVAVQMGTEAISSYLKALHTQAADVTASWLTGRAQPASTALSKRGVVKKVSLDALKWMIRCPQYITQHQRTKAAQRTLEAQEPGGSARTKGKKAQHVN